MFEYGLHDAKREQLFDIVGVTHSLTQIHTVGVGAAIGHACLLLAAGAKGKRFMMPHAKAMIQRPRIPSSGLMTGSDLLIRAKEVCFIIIFLTDFVECSRILV